MRANIIHGARRCRAGHPSVAWGVLAALVSLASASSCGGGGGGGRGSRGPTLRTGGGAEYLAHEVVVRVPDGTTDEALARALAKLGGRVVDASGPLGQLGFRRVALPASVTADVAISDLVAGGAVAKAEPNYVVEAFVTPSDPRMAELWGMAKIEAPAAWDTASTSPNVIVAVSDTGIDPTHPELATNVWVNGGEVPGNNVDDDGNGYVDDVHGFDFVNNDGDPRDDHGHGTHVSGTIGAAANNAVGVAGVTWNVKIQGLKFLDAAGRGSTWNAAKAVLYASAMKARVMNASWGCLGSGCYASYLDSAIKTLEQSGGIFIAAAGNNANDNDAVPTYPANYSAPSLVTVAATDSKDALASFSNYGATRVHVAAPGVGILSTTPNGGYASWNGTSMATPHVAGAAALFLGQRPDATPLEVKQKLLETCDPVAGLAGKVSTGGRLNLRRLIAAAGKPPAAPAGFQAAPGGQADVLLSWSASAEPDLAGYRVRYGTATGHYTTSVEIAKTVTSARIADLLVGTKYFFVVHAVNATGLASAPSVERQVLVTDAIAPPQVVDLVAGPIPGGEASGEVLGASGEFSSFWAAAQAHDGSPETAWISPRRDQPEEEFVTVGLFTPFLIEAVELLPSAAYPELFPVDFDVEIASDGQDFRPVGGLRNASVVAGQRVRIAFPPVVAAHVRLRVLRSARHASGSHYAALAEMTIYETSSAPDGLRLSFTAPGDDPGRGRAARYDIRRASTPLSDGSFAAGTPVVPSGAPLGAGLVEQITDRPLAGETTYFFALKAIDAAGNVSPMSNVASASTLIVPPSTVTDLRVVEVAGAAAAGAVTLAWTAPGGDGREGQAARYDLRLSTTAITPGSFAGANVVAGVAAPSPAGATEYFTLTDLEPGQLYYFALRAVDASGAAGGVSNVVVAMPVDGDDVTPPARVGDLFASMSNAKIKVAATVDSVSDELSVARAAGNLLDGNPATAWQTSAGPVDMPAWVVFDLGKAQPLARVRTNPSSLELLASYPQAFRLETSTDKVAWTPFVEVEGLKGKVGVWNDWAAPVSVARYVRLYVVKRGPAAGPAVHAAMGELELYALTPELDADLTWVAPGDDGFAGRAARYELRRATTPIDESTFAAAELIPTLQPLPGGMIEVLPLASLPGEATLYFALRAADSTGNLSPLSNVAVLKTPGVPPAPISDLAVSATTKTSVTLTFSATGDDGMAGRATAYELRYATSPITPLTWELATPVTPAAPAPQAPGSRELITAAGLAPTTLYHFAVKVVDDAGNRSVLSNVVSVATRDGTPPAAVADLAVSPVDPAARPALALTVTAASGSYSPETEPKNLLDGSEGTEWVSAATATVQPAFVELALDSARRLGRLRMRATAQNRDLFPVDFTVEARATAESAWQPIASESGFVTAGGWEEWSLGSAPATSIRLVITKTASWTGKFMAALADFEVYEDGTDATTLRLSWTAPGDDGDKGTAAAYDLRRAGAPITESGFAAATVVPGLPAPQPAGRLERFEARALSPETKYCFAIKARDEEGNESAVSSSASSCATTPGMPPGTITDLQVTATTARTATLAFTAPGADGAVGQAAQYEVRRSEKRITSASWADATPVSGAAAPAPAGTREIVTVAGLTGLKRYFFAVRAVDAAGNAAAISNNAVGTTLDDVPPSKVVDLAVSTNAVAAGSLTLTWTAPGDSGTTGQAKSYDVRVSATPFGEANFSAGTPVVVGAPSVAGTREVATISGLAAEQTYHVALRTIDAAGNVSAVSNVASGATREEPPAAVSDLAIVGGSGREANNATLIVQWTAPGDDARVGTAVSYDLRRATGPISEATFSQATPVLAGVPVPAPAGTLQQAIVTGLVPGVKVYFALKTTDDRGNVSALSNVASASPPDEVPPAAALDLAATAGTAPGTLVVSLTAPGDDGLEGKATAYELRWAAGPLDAGSFAAGTLAATPPPGTPGAKQSFTITGLPNETDVTLLLRTKDDAGNWSALSNAARATTPNVPPAAVGDLAVIGRGVGTLTLGWTATGDDGKWGTAVAYDLRRSTAAITEANFASAVPVATGAPGGAGVAETATATGLEANQTYHFALKVKDDRDNWSALSNVAVSTSEDTLAPGPIVLAAARGTAAGSIVLSWTAPGDDGDKGTAKRYDLRRSSSAITASSWNAATPVPLPAPKAAGTPESFTVTNLKGETVHHFALRAFDEADNAGPLSNGAAAETAPIPPATIALSAALVISGSRASATLSWSAPGDDGAEGQASAYDLRYSTAPLTAANFATASVVPVAVPAPAAAGTAQSVSVPELQESTTYYFAIRAADDKEAWSALSNVASVVVPDLTKPAAPGGLTVTVPDVASKRLPLVGVTASSVLGPAWDAANLGDGDATSSWASAASDTNAPADFVVDLGAARSIEEVKLTPDVKYLELFPPAFRIGVSADGRTWKDLVTEEGFIASSAEPLSWGFVPETARYVRVHCDQLGKSFGKHYAIVAEIAVMSAAASDGQSQLTWLAPGDDGLAGKASKYEVYRYTRPFVEAELGAVTLVSNPPVPGPAGSLQTMTVTGLHGETTYHFAVRAIDEAGNAGPLSVVVAGTTNAVRPAPVRNLAGRATGETAIELTWNATGDDGLEGVAANAELRYAAGTLSSQTFAAATLVPGLPPPAAARAAQTVAVSGLRPGATYRFALVATDAGGNRSFLSNVATVKTQSPPDVTPPARIVDLTVAAPPPGGRVLSGTVTAKSSEQSVAFPAVAAADGRTDTFWASAARASSQEEWVRVEYRESATVDRVSLWPAAGYPELFPPDVAVRVSPDGLAWTEVASATNLVATSGSPVVLPFGKAVALRFVELRAKRLPQHASGIHYTALAEIEAFTANEPAGTLVASWTSPDDDGPTGHAASYDLRVGACPLVADAAMAVGTTSPQNAGTPERARITGLAPGTHCVAVRSADPTGNRSELSNVAQFTVP